MGWASGSEIAENVWRVVRKYVPQEKRERVSNEIIDIFENEDADTMSEAETLWKDSHRMDEDADEGFEDDEEYDEDEEDGEHDYDDSPL